MSTMAYLLDGRNAGHVVGSRRFLSLLQRLHAALYLHPPSRVFRIFRVFVFMHFLVLLGLSGLWVGLPTWASGGKAEICFKLDGQRGLCIRGPK